MKVEIRTYTSPTLVLLAFNWEEGEAKDDFLGFAINRTPGFEGEQASWLPNRIGFRGPEEHDLPSNKAPIQKFYWWDARIDTKDRGAKFTYVVTPVLGTPGAFDLDKQAAVSIDVLIPHTEEHGITTHFNRAVVSSQAFSKEFPSLNTPAKQKAAQAWLANGMEHAIPEFLDRAKGKDIEGAIYHLTDENWIIPALRHYGGSISLAYNHTSKDDQSDAAIEGLENAGRASKNFAARTHANIMHDKFLVRVGAADHAEAVLTGSANFTGGALSAQANVLHTFESPALADLYLQRKRLLDEDPGLAETRTANEGWSRKIRVGDATVRAFFPPEDKNTRESLETIVEAINNAEHSVLLCAFDPTDRALLDAIFKAADDGKMMLALVNRVPANTPKGGPDRADVFASIAIMDRAGKDGSVTGFGAFRAGDTPTDFAPERVLWPHEDPKIMVRVHHKFVVIDGQGTNPIVFTGSANFSGNSLHNNDENLLEISESPRMAGMYLAEFLRLYEHYRARAAFNRREHGESDKFQLTPDNRWAKKYFVANSPEMKARVTMSGTPS